MYYLWLKQYKDPRGGNYCYPDPGLPIEFYTVLWSRLSITGRFYIRHPYCYGYNRPRKYETLRGAKLGQNYYTRQFLNELPLEHLNCLEFDITEV